MSDSQIKALKYELIFCLTRCDGLVYLFVIFYFIAGYGNFTFRMDFYHSAAFETPYTEKDYPIQISLNEYLYVKYSVESSADLVIMAENCKATKDGSYHSWPQHHIIQNG